MLRQWAWFWGGATRTPLTMGPITALESGAIIVVGQVATSNNVRNIIITNEKVIESLH